MAPLNIRDQRLADRYELERELNADGQAVDWLARDLALDRRVVVRLLDPGLARDETATELFWQAARAAARTSAIGEPRILDGGTDAATGQVFVVREWREMAGGPQAVSRAVTAVGANARVPRRRSGERTLPGWPLSRGRTVVLGLVAALAVGGGLLGASASAWLAWVNEPLGRPAQRITLAPPVGAPAGQPIGAEATPPPTLTAAAQQSSADPTPVPTPTDTRAAGDQRRVVNTEGLGVALRVSPGGDRQPGQGYPEGALVTAFEQQGAWARIRGADGREGWVLAVTLQPAGGAAAAATPPRPGAPPATALAGPPAPTAGTTSARAGAPAPATPAVAANARQRVANTDGLGVALRASPNGDRLPGKGYDEGAPVTVLDRSGPWTHIRGDDGRDGWVPSVTLAPS